MLDHVDKNAFSDAKTTPQVFDRFGDALEYILLVPLYGEKHKFMNAADALTFMKEVPENAPQGQLKFMYLETLIVFQNGDRHSMCFQKKEKVVAMIEYFFETT